MSRQQFTSRNNIGQVLTFQKSGSTTSFDPTVTFSSGSRRVSWRLDNGSGTTQTVDNVITYTGFTSDPAIRTIQMRGNSFRNIRVFNLSNDNLYGHLDLTSLSELGGVLGFGGVFQVFSNRNLTGITHSQSSQHFSQYYAYNCNLTGNLDLTPLSRLGGDFQVFSNTSLTSITHTQSSQNFSQYVAYDCNLTGNLDLTPLSGLGGSFQVYGNRNLTGITHSHSSRNFSSYWAQACNLTGNLNLTPLSGLGGSFSVHSNTGLTSITHTQSSQNFSSYMAYGCNLTGNLDLTPLSGLGGNFQVYNNTGLTNITHTQSSQNFSAYIAYGCNLTGNLDLTPLSGLGGAFGVYGNTNLTGITHTQSSRNFTAYLANTCNLTGTLDLSPLTKLGGSSSGISSTILTTYSNPNLTNIIFPNSNQFFKNSENNESNGAFALQSCNLDYIDFTPLSGSTLLSGSTQGRPRISLRDNGMSSTDVNHILVDFSGNATNNQIGWSNINLNIGGTNSAPDSSSGGYNGIAARNFLTGSPYNWIITHS